MTIEAGGPDVNEVGAFHSWLAAVEVEAREMFGADDRLGTANHIDAGARLRAAACVRTGGALSLARPLVEAPGMSISISTFNNGDVVVDRMEASCHGHTKTHLDALNHMAEGGRFYGGRSAHDSDLPTIVDLAEHGLFTRAVVADIPAVRGTPWIEADHPVTAADIDAATADVEIAPGDALLLYMGRDRWEEAGYGHEAAAGPLKPGAGRSVAQWVWEHRISIVGWDFIDAQDVAEPTPEEKGTVHRLLAAAGLVLIDNCHLGPAARELRRQGRRSGALAALPLGPVGGTGSLVTPWLFL